MMKYVHYLICLPKKAGETYEEITKEYFTDRRRQKRKRLEIPSEEIMDCLFEMQKTTPELEGYVFPVFFSENRRRVKQYVFVNEEGMLEFREM